jgi:hypothetical protein
MENLESVPTELLQQALVLRIFESIINQQPPDMDFIDAIDVELFSRGSKLGTELADTL